MTDQYGGEDIDGIDLYPGDCFAAPLINRGRIQGFHVDAGGAVEVVFEGGLVDDDVDQRLDHPDDA